ncbi:ParA family protein [Streptantibioticus ferralitis]|uniref:ParA family protein n=1 Tax=Streptantibioticus ferralitis TaxID=236510 RepID=A0ABT5ZB86_9ACTN|nr:ParA family protein [Streptantibioticus ferralitis]MDF2260943.1 ParA family protein [Streptantibioticus ferralitis]
MGKHKGGVGCTVSALELAYAATRRTIHGRPRRVAILDLDPQGNATDVLEPKQRRIGIKDVLAPPDPATARPLALRDVLIPTAWDNVLLAPADRHLANRETDLTPHGIATLRRARLSGEIADMVDDVVIDLPRDIGRLAATGLLGMEHLFICAQASIWGAQGAEEMRYTVRRISEKGNPELAIAGIVVAAYDDARDSRRVLESMKSRFGNLLLDPPVPRKVRVREAVESYHTPCREFGGRDLEEVADVYQKFYDSLLAQDGSAR